MITKSEPIFAVTNIQKTIAFYKDILGGRGEWLWGSPPEFAGIYLGEVMLKFNLQPDLAFKIQGHQHHFFSETIDDLHAQHLASNAPIINPIENKPWGFREYTIQDPDGYHLRFCGPTRHEKPPTALESLPEHIRIEHRLPTWEQYKALQRSVGWNYAADTPQMLEQSCCGMVAVDTRNNQTVGMVRVANPAHMWYSIWDVVVRPEHQSQRIGSAMIQATLDHLRLTAPAGSSVYLFTYSHGFYETLGFKMDTCSLLKL